MASINVDLDFIENPKIRRFSIALGPNSPIHLIRLWIHVGKYHYDDGMFKGYSIEEIEKVADWRGKKGVLIEVMEKYKLLDNTPDGFAIHDWKEHGAHIARYKHRRKKDKEKNLAKYDLPSPDNLI